MKIAAYRRFSKYLPSVFSFILCLFTFYPVLCQQGKFYVRIDAAVLDPASQTYQTLKNSAFQIAFVLENMEGSQFTPPSFKDFLVVQGPSTSSEISIINGRRSEKKSYIYTLAGVKEGVFIIEAATMNTSSGVLATEPLHIKILPTTEDPEIITGGEATIVRVEAQDSVVYMGQQLLVSINLYTRENIKSYEALQAIQFDGFFVRELGRVSRTARRVFLGNQEYYMTTLKTYALFPQRKGNFTFAPINIRVGIPEESKSRSFFSFPEYSYKILTSEPLEIEVKDLPLRAPNSFSGAVGKYLANFSINKKTLTTDESLVLRMEIRGDGDGKNITPPWLDFGDDFEIYDPTVLRDENFEDGQKMSDIKVFEYLILPSKEGRYELLPEFSYFDTDSLEYVTLSPDEAFVVNIARGSAAASDALLSGKRNLMPNQSSATWTRPSYQFMGSKVYYALCSLCFLGILSMVSLRKYQDHLEAMDPVEKARRKANKVAVERLKLAHDYIEQNHHRAFYDELTKTLFQYIEGKLNIATGSLSKHQLAERLQSLTIEKQTIEKCLTVLNQAELSLFAGKNTGSMKEMYEQAVSVISDVENTTSQADLKLS